MGEDEFREADEVVWAGGVCGSGWWGEGEGLERGVWEEGVRGVVGEGWKGERVVEGSCRLGVLSDGCACGKRKVHLFDILFRILGSGARQSIFWFYTYGW